MRFKNISEKTKHIMVDGSWLVVNPGDEFSISRPGRLHLDPDLEKIVVEEEDNQIESDNEESEPKDEQETLPEAPEDTTTTESLEPDGDGKKKTSWILTMMEWLMKKMIR